VINKQRETIYAERNKVLHNEDLTETIRSFVDDEMDHLVDQYCQGSIPDEWDIEALSHALHAIGLDGPGTTTDDLWDAGGREPLLGHLHELADGKLDAREAETGESTGRWSSVSSSSGPSTRCGSSTSPSSTTCAAASGFALRAAGSAQRVQEGGLRLYEELRDLIRRQVATTIFRVTVVKEEPQPMPTPDFSGGLPVADEDAAGTAATAASFGGQTAGAAASGSFGAATVTGSGGGSRSSGSAHVHEPIAKASRARPR